MRKLLVGPPDSSKWGNRFNFSFISPPLKGKKQILFRFVAGEQKRTNILFSLHCYSLNWLSYDFVVFLESPLSLPKYSVNCPIGWAG